MPAKTIITRLKHVTIARRATVKCLAPFCSVSPAVAQCAFSIRNSILPTLLVAPSAVATGEAQFERHRFLTGFLVPKMVPKILQANLIFYVVFATLASQTVLAEKLKVFKKARRDASSPV